jgi:transcriptional regulator with XRE-family HTH domain
VSERAVTPRPDRARDRLRLGETIRRLRLAQGRTLADVADDAAISVSLLSQVERGLIDPSLDSLREIAEALGTAPFRLLADGVPASRIVRDGEGRKLALADSEVEMELLSPSLDGAFEVGRWTLRPGGATAAQPRGYPGEEATLILRGRVRFELGDEPVELSEGDFVTYDARIPHRCVAVGNEPASGLFVVSPPSF